MKQICSIYLVLIFSLTTAVVWGQTDTTGRNAKTDSTKFRSVVSDRINEPDELERGPSLGKMLKKADESFAKKNFFAAMKYYGFALKADPLQVGALKGRGESALEIRSLDIADSVFQFMVDRGLSPSPNYFPKMRLAEVKFRKGLYDEAMLLYHDIATAPQIPPVPADTIQIAKEREKLCLWAQEDGLDNPYTIIKKFGDCPLDTCYRLDTANVSTAGFSEYVAYPFDGKLFFSAYRFDLKKDRQTPKRNAIKVLQAEGSEGNLGQDKKMVLSEWKWDLNDVKKQHIAHLTFNYAHNVVYYAMGDYLHDSADIRFDLYRSVIKPDSTWGAPEKLDSVNMAGFTSTEPSIGMLPGDNFETLFFVTDRPNGQGKKDKDIWYSRIIGDKVSTPLPLDALNTPGDDVTPFYHAASNTLFFSTDGRRTLGGFDVYKTKPLSGGTWKTPEHMGAYINSSANDVFFVLDEQSRRGFFSSNRNGNTNYSEEGCCYDIFYVDFLVKYKALALHKLTGKILPYTRITLFEEGKKGALEMIASPEPLALSTYAFDVKLGNKYMLIAEKADFTSDTLHIKTPEELWTTEIVDTLRLTPHINLVASVWDCESGEPVYGATAKLFRFKKGAKPQTDLLPEDSNKKDYKIDFEQRYQVVMEKEGYDSPDTSEIVSTIGRVEGGTIFVDLKLRRPDPFVNFDTIALYFDNDFPKRTKGTDSLLVNATGDYSLKMKEALLKNPKDPVYQDSVLIDYRTTFVDYARRYDTLFIPQYIKGLKGQARIRDSVMLRNFFENEVRVNEARFRDFAEKLEGLLQQGDSITIDIQGFASPLSDPDYNLHLSNRRTASVYNMFVRFDGGVFLYRPRPDDPTQFLGYYKPDNSGQLKFNRIPNGEAASKYKGPEAEDRHNPRTAIYDVRASMERRVEITGVKVKKANCKTK